jgi:glycosyltransferase involved in cell wall biosynthesis
MRRGKGERREAVLFVAPQVPFPLDTGGKIRTFYQLRALASAFEVDLLTLGEALPVSERGPLWEELEGELRAVWRAPREGLSRAGVWEAAARGVVGPLPYPVEKYRSARASLMIEELTRGGRYKAVHFDSLHTFRFAPLVAAGTAKVLDEHNVEALILERMASVSPAWKRPLVEQQARLTDAFERRSAREADRVLLCSEEDRALLAERTGRAEGFYVIPNGVDVHRFERAKVELGEAEAPYVLFLGSMDWWPNDDGIRWFVETAWPLVRRSRPDLRLKVVGRNPSAALKKLADSAVDVVGGVPDVRQCMAKCAAFVVPLRVGGGTRLKILEAFSMSAPVISTRIGYEGIAAEPGRELLVADEPVELAREVLRVCDDPALGRRLGEAGRRLVEARYSWEAIGERLVGLYRALGS